jgi:hypothetical protein
LEIPASSAITVTNSAFVILHVPPFFNNKKSYKFTIKRWSPCLIVQNNFFVEIASGAERSPELNASCCGRISCLKGGFKKIPGIARDLKLLGRPPAGSISETAHVDRSSE